MNPERGGRMEVFEVIATTPAMRRLGPAREVAYLDRWGNAFEEPES